MTTPRLDAKQKNRLRRCPLKESVADTSTPGSANPIPPSPQPVRHHERFVALVQGDRALILAAYELALVESQSPLIGDSRSRDETLADGAEILSDVEDGVWPDTVQMSRGHNCLFDTTGEAPRASEANPTDLLRAAAVFFNVTVNTLARHVGEDPSLLPAFLNAVHTLNESIDERIRGATLAFNGYLLDRVHKAHSDERHRIARELHDWFGEGVSGALRQLELHELTEPGQPIEPALHTALAKEALLEAMHRLRQVISELRFEPVTCLEEAINEYVAALAVDVDVRVRVSGDQDWATPAVVNETFMIIREALRNALAHAAPQLVLIGVDLAPQELRARIDDDGRGWEPRPDPGGGSAHSAGVAIMRERAALIGGRLSVSSSPGQGTRVELLVPLPGTREER